MKKKMFLTSAIAMGVVAPAVAAPTNTGTFPSSGLMQEDYTYTNAATAENMDSVYEGSVNATAQYDVIDYILSAGQYLPKDSDVQTTCPAGSYCAGGTFQYDEDSDQGLTSCSTVTSGIYALSDAGASSQNDCYRQCTTTDVEHSTGVSGNYYYGDNNQCEPTACVKGWHIKPAVNGSAIASIGNTTGVNSAHISGGGFSEHNYDDQGYHQVGERLKGQTYYGFNGNEDNSWAVDYGDKGILVGQGRCSTVSGATHTTSELDYEGGQYCYCNLTGYKAAGGNMQSLSTPWGLKGKYDDASDCKSYCTRDCAVSMRSANSSNLAFRAVLLGTVNSDTPAMCEATDYLLNAGKYLPADGETPTTCLAGYFCSGIGTVQYNETSDQGIQSCPTGYALSAAGASSQNECYRTCITSDAAHSTGVSGGYYYGDNNQCEPTGCVNGWHIKAGLDLTNTIGQVGGTSNASIRNDGSFSESSASHGATYYGLTDNNTWAVDYGDKGFLYGQGRCSTRAGTEPVSSDRSTFNIYPENFVSSLTDETGQAGAGFCYCNVTGYKDASGTLHAVSSSWVFRSYMGGADGCKGSCVEGCSGDMRFSYPIYLAYRAAVLGTVQPIPATCEANTITINWTHAEQTDIDANNAGTATYGEDVRTPVKAETIKGKTFLGWKFSKPEQTPLP